MVMLHNFDVAVNFLICYFLASSFVHPVSPKLGGFLFVTFPGFLTAGLPLFAQQ